MLDKLTLDDFRGQIGEQFRLIPAEGEPFDVELLRADPAERQAGHERVPFSLEFRSPLDHHLPQQTFGVEHPDLGTFPLFLVPLAPDADGHRFEAVFS